MNKTIAPRSAVVRARIVCRAQQQPSGDMPSSFFCPNTKKPCPKCPRGGCRPCARNGVAPTLHKNAVEKEAIQAIQKATSSSELQLQSTPAAGLMALSLAGVNPFLNFLQGQADYFSTLNLPAGLIKYGHPGNMAVVLLAMGGYGALYLGWQIRLADNVEMRRKAMDLHPKLAGGMAVFFLLGSMGGMMSLLMQNENPFHSGHFTSGVLGLLALSLQAMLPLFFEDDPNARNFHAYFGTGVMALFFIHAALGVQLALSI